MFRYSVIILLALLDDSAGYRLGPPLTACGNMTTGHPFAPQTIPSPFTFTLNATQYNPGDVVEVFLNSYGDWFLEGALIQMRKDDCNNSLSDSNQAVGTFMAEENDIFLQPFNCFGRSASAIRHYSHFHIYNRTFYWRAPAEAVGHVRIWATIARNEEKYWLNVMSGYLWDASVSNHQTCGTFRWDTSGGDYQTCGADGTAFTIAVLVLILAFTYIIS